MKTADLKKKYLEVFLKKSHQLLPNASLVPENDPTALFINSGMHPLVPYLFGETHPLGRRLTSNQRCLRTQDIEKIGDSSHLTFFEMLGNWSLGDYWKKEAISLSWEFLTKELKLDFKRIFVTCFAGDKKFKLPKDEESAAIWQSLGLPSAHIYFLGKKYNWWSVGESGLCGSDTEMFYDTGKTSCGTDCHPGDNCGKYLEIWNDVFMEFDRQLDGSLKKLQQRNIDTGMGVERTAAILQGKDDVYQTEVFKGLINHLEKISGKKYEKDNKKAMRIIIDHLRAATFAIGDGVYPANTEAGYVVRRLIRRAIRYGKDLNLSQSFISEIGNEVIIQNISDYPYLNENKEIILKELKQEEEKFQKTLEKGLKEFNKKISSSLIDKTNKIDGKTAFFLYETYGFPLELTQELSQEKGLEVDQKEFLKLQKEHQGKSRLNSNKKFAGGLTDHSEIVTKLHTVTHLLHQALRKILGEEVHQVGSNITPERLRFDFTYPEKLTVEKLNQIEEIINKEIQKNLPVKMEIMSLKEAKNKGALAFFNDKYGQEVKVYSIGDFSKEVCGGPHMTSLKEIGSVKIIKEEAIGTGKRRIYAQIK